MAIEQVKAYLKSVGLIDRLMEFDTSSATVTLAAEAVGCEPARIAKTLAFKADEESCILIVVAGDGRIDNKKFKHQFKMKAKMLSPEEVLSFTGYAVGGVCPFAVEHPSVRIYADTSLKRFSTVFPAGGNSASAVELTLDELVEHGQIIDFVDVCQ